MPAPRKSADSGKPRYDVPALEKGLDILEALASSEEPVSLSDLAVRLGRSRNELFRMLDCLVSRGYVLRETATGRAALSLKLHQLAHAHSPVALLLRHAREPMRRFVAATGESCHLSVLDPGGLMVIHMAQSSAPVRLLIETGVYFDPVLTVSGRLLLSAMGDDERLPVLAGSAAWRSFGIGRRKGFLAGLAKIPKEGISRASDESVRGVRDAAVLVGGSGSSLRAALAISVLTGETNSASLRKLETGLAATAAGISAELP